MQDLLGYSGLLASLTHGSFICCLAQQFMQYINMHDIHLTFIRVQANTYNGPIKKQPDSYI